MKKKQINKVYHVLYIIKGVMSRGYHMTIYIYIYTRQGFLNTQLSFLDMSNHFLRLASHFCNMVQVGSCSTPLSLSLFCGKWTILFSQLSIL